MPNFNKLFIESQGQPIIYNGIRLVRADKFGVSNGDTLIISIEKTNNVCRQGISIDITGYCEIDGKVFKQGKGIMMLFWEDTIGKPTKIKVFTKKDFVWIENIWENTTSYLITTPLGEPVTKESKSVDYGHNGAAMIIEEIENGRRYQCNDGYPDENFDDIIFTVQKVKQ